MDTFPLHQRTENYRKCIDGNSHLVRFSEKPLACFCEFKFLALLTISRYYRAIHRHTFTRADNS